MAAGSWLGAGFTTSRLRRPQVNQVLGEMCSQQSAWPDFILNPGSGMPLAFLLPDEAAGAT